MDKIEWGERMSIGFNWFKSYEIEDYSQPYCDDFRLTYIGGDSTSHSGGNIGKVQDLLEKYTGKRIPTVCDDWISSTDYDLNLIEPSEMSEICSKVLATTEVDEVDMRDRIEWFKKLSDEGYYLTYDMF